MKSCDFDYVTQISQLPTEQRLAFYESLASNLTVSVRAVWSDEKLSDSEKVDRMKWLNEIMHHITAKISVTRQNKREWTERDMWEMIKGFASQNPGIRGDVANAVLYSYRTLRVHLSNEQEDKSLQPTFDQFASLVKALAEPQSSITP